MDSTGLGSAAMASVSPSQTSYTIKDLVPVTHYIVTVHASNGVGRGRDSVLANVTTNAIGELVARRVIGVVGWDD